MAAPDDGDHGHRVFLVVVDDSEEMRAALRYACRRARHTGGRVALLRIVEPNDYREWVGVGKLMHEEAREEAEMLLHRMANEVYACSGETPVLYVREGNPREELLKLVNEDPTISILVLASGTGSEGPGPLITALTGKYRDRLRIPMAIVPGSLSDEDIMRIT